MPSIENTEKKPFRFTKPLSEIRWVRAVLYTGMAITIGVGGLVAYTYKDKLSRLAHNFNFGIEVGGSSHPTSDKTIMNHVYKSLNSAFNAKFKILSVDHNNKSMKVKGIVPVKIAMTANGKTVERVVFASMDGKAIIPGAVLTQDGIPLGMSKTDYEKAKAASIIQQRRQGQRPRNVNYDATVMFHGKPVDDNSMWNNLLANTDFVKEGEGKQKVYVFFDPLSEHCRQLYKNTRALVAAGKLQIDWIPVSHVSEKSAKYTSWLLQNKSTDSLRSLMDDPSKIRVSGITNKSNPINLELAEFLMGNRIATPSMAFRNNGKTRFVVGATERMLEQISNG